MNYDELIHEQIENLYRQNRQPKLIAMSQKVYSDMVRKSGFTHFNMPMFTHYAGIDVALFPRDWNNLEDERIVVL